MKTIPIQAVRIKAVLKKHITNRALSERAYEALGLEPEGVV
jgi:hypothetical protein